MAFQIPVYALFFTVTLFHEYGQKVSSIFTMAMQGSFPYHTYLMSWLTCGIHKTQSTAQTKQDVHVHTRKTFPIFSCLYWRESNSVYGQLYSNSLRLIVSLVTPTSMLLYSIRYHGMDKVAWRSIELTRGKPNLPVVMVLTILSSSGREHYLQHLPSQAQ